MNATEPLTEEAALWASVNEMPGDQLRRLVLADWYEERASVVKCPVSTCGNPAEGWDGFYRCLICSGTGFITNGYADMAAALRATAGMAPYPTHGVHDEYWWYGREGGNKVNMVPLVVWHELTGKVNESWSSGRMKDYTTAADAIRDLCRAWVRVHRGGTA